MHLSKFRKALICFQVFRKIMRGYFDKTALYSRLGFVFCCLLSACSYSPTYNNVSHKNALIEDKAIDPKLPLPGTKQWKKSMASARFLTQATFEPMAKEIVKANKISKQK